MFFKLCYGYRVNGYIINSVNHASGGESMNDLVELIAEDACGAGTNQLRDQVAFDFFFHDDFQCNPILISQLIDGR